MYAQITHGGSHPGFKSQSGHTFCHSHSRIAPFGEDSAPLLLPSASFERAKTELPALSVPLHTSVTPLLSWQRHLLLEARLRQRISVEPPPGTLCNPIKGSGQMLHSFGLCCAVHLTCCNEQYHMSRLSASEVGKVPRCPLV